MENSLLVESMRIKIRKLKGKTSLLVLLVLTLFTTAYYPALKLMVNNWANSDEYSHAFIVLPVIAYMIWSKRHQLRADQANFTLAGIIILAISFPIYLFALMTHVQTLIYFSLYLTIIGAVIFLFGLKAIKIIGMPLILFAMLIPVPEQLYIKLTFPLQLKVTEVSELVIRLVGIPVLREGNILSIPGKRFEVVEACSGMRSLITLSTLSVIAGYFMLKKVYSKLILIVASLPLAIMVNMIRVICMVIVFYLFNLDLSEGGLHTVFGLLIFGIALLGLFSLTRISIKLE